MVKLERSNISFFNRIVTGLLSALRSDVLRDATHRQLPSATLTDFASCSSFSGEGASAVAGLCQITQRPVTDDSQLELWPGTLAIIVSVHKEPEPQTSARCNEKIAQRSFSGGVLHLGAVHPLCSACKSQPQQPLPTEQGGSSGSQFVCEHLNMVNDHDSSSGRLQEIG